jgi:hypothetical protein
MPTLLRKTPLPHLIRFSWGHKHHPILNVWGNTPLLTSLTCCVSTLGMLTQLCCCFCCIYCDHTMYVRVAHSDVPRWPPWTCTRSVCENKHLLLVLPLWIHVVMLQGIAATYVQCYEKRCCCCEQSRFACNTIMLDRQNAALSQPSVIVHLRLLKPCDQGLLHLSRRPDNCSRVQL